jgi:hypothetical protein
MLMALVEICFHFSVEKERVVFMLTIVDTLEIAIMWNKKKY